MAPFCQLLLPLAIAPPGVGEATEQTQHAQSHAVEMGIGPQLPTVILGAPVEAAVCAMIAATGPIHRFPEIVRAIGVSRGRGLLTIVAGLSQIPISKAQYYDQKRIGNQG